MAKKKVSKALRQAASALGRLGGLTKSPARAAASRENGKLGWPSKVSTSSSPKKITTPKK